MASVTGLSKIGLPHLSENMQLQYVLCNLDMENMSESLRTRLNSIQ